MSALWIIPPCIEEPSAAALTALREHALFAHADALAQKYTGAELVTRVSVDPARDWVRARLRSVAACLAAARTRLVHEPAPLVVLGLAYGELVAFALSGALPDRAALEVALRTAEAVVQDAPGLTVRLSNAPAQLGAPGVEFTRLSPGELIAAGTPQAIATLLAPRSGTVVGGFMHGPTGATARAAAARVFLHGLVVPSTCTLLLADSVTAEEPRTLSAEPHDLLRSWRLARALGCTRYVVLGEELAPFALEAAVAPEPGYYLGEVREQRADFFRSERVLSLEAEPYLETAARLHKTSVLPGSFELEIGLEAGQFLHPDLVPVRIDNALFHSALKLFPGQPATMKLEATSHERPDGSHAVQLTIMSDLVHKSGRILQADRRHCELTVIMARTFPEAPPPMQFAKQRAEPDPDVPRVLYQSGSPLWLGPYFEAVWNTSRAGKLVQSTYRNPADLSLPAFGRHLGAPLLMDAVLQNPMRRSGPYLAVGIPLSIRSVRFYGTCNERQIIEQHGQLVLTSEVDDDLPYCERMQASTSDGRVLLEVERFELIPLGWIDRRDLSVRDTPGEGRTVGRVISGGELERT